jgi:hypothetical protein
MKHCGQAKPAASVVESARRTLKPIDAEERRPTAAWLSHDARWFDLVLTPIVAVTPWPALAQASAPKAPTENSTTVGSLVVVGKAKPKTAPCTDRAAMEQRRAERWANGFKSFYPLRSTLVSTSMSGERRRAGARVGGLPGSGRTDSKCRTSWRGKV